jgi:hypothetical protein
LMLGRRGSFLPCEREFLWCSEPRLGGSPDLKATLSTNARIPSNASISQINFSPYYA